MKNLYNLVLKDSPLDCPFAPNKKNGLFSWLPVVGPALDYAIGTVFGTEASNQTNLTNEAIADKNRAATEVANEKNIALQRETNAQNYQMFKDQQAFAEDMWNKQNAYNDPKAQVQRLLAAGINPSSGFGQASEAGSIGSPSPSQMVAPQVQPETMDWSAVSPDASAPLNAVNAFFQNQLLSKQVQEKDVDTQIKSVQLFFKGYQEMADLQEKMSRIGQALQNAKKGTAEYDYLIEQKNMLQTQHNLLKDTFEDLRKRESLQNDIMTEQKNNLVSDTQLKRVQSRYQNVVMQYYPQITRAQLNKIDAEIANIVQTTESLVIDGRLKTEQAIKESINNRILKLDIWEKEFKHGVKYGSNATKTLQAFSDYVAGLIFGNIKLFGR